MTFDIDLMTLRLLLLILFHLPLVAARVAARISPSFPDFLFLNPLGLDNEVIKYVNKFTYNTLESFLENLSTGCLKRT